MEYINACVSKMQCVYC